MTFASVVSQAMMAKASTASAQLLQGTTDIGTDNTMDKLKVSLLLVSALAVPAIAQLVSKTIAGSSWTHRIVWSAAFALNLITVSIPGRFDSQMKDGKVGPPWVTLFEPAGWAFAIWGVIYLGEMALTAFATVNGKPIAVLQDAAPYWLAGNLFQSLWCFAFRPQFKQKLWIPAIFLLSGAISFGGSHRVFTDAITNLGPGLKMDKIALLLMRAPIALHTAWLAGATLLNINGWVTVSNLPSAWQIAVAFTSSFGASVVGTFLALRTKDPLISATVAWTLAALSSKTKEKVVTKADTKYPNEVYDSLALVQDWLSKFMKLVTLAIATTGAIKNLF